MLKKLLCLFVSIAMISTMIPSAVVMGAEDMIIVGTNNGGAGEIGTIDTNKVSKVLPYQMSLLNSISSVSDRLGGKEASDSYITGDYYAVDGALFASVANNASKRYKVYSFNTYGAGLQKAKVRFASNLKVVCANNISTNPATRSNQWNNIAFVCDTSTLDTYTYVNGTLVAENNVVDVIKSMGYSVDDKGDIYSSDGALVKNLSFCFSDIRFDVPKAGVYSFDDLTIAHCDTIPAIDTPALLPDSEDYSIDGDIINVSSDVVTLPAIEGTTYIINGVAGGREIKAGDTVTLKKSTPLGNLFTAYTAIDPGNPLVEVVSRRDGLDGIENYFSTMENVTFEGEACSLLKGVNQDNGSRQMFLHYVNAELNSADIVLSSAFYANENVDTVYFATSGHAKMGVFDKSLFVPNAWNTITLIVDGDTGLNTAYINGNKVGELTQPVISGIVRIVVNSANTFLEGTDIYIDNFYVLKGSINVPSVTTTLDTVGSRVITGVYGKTYQQIKDSFTFASPAIGAEFVYGDVVQALTDKVKNGAKVNIYDRGVFVADYTFSFEQPIETVLTSHDGFTDSTIQKLYSEYSVQNINGNPCAYFIGTASTNSDHLFIQKSSNSCEGDLITSINIMPCDNSGSVFFATSKNARLSSDVNISKLNKGEWNNLTLIMDGTTSENKLYVNGEYFGTATGLPVSGIIRFIVKDTTVVGKKIYMDDFAIIKGKTEFPPLSSSLDILGLTINGYVGMTYKELAQALVPAKKSMTLSAFTLNGESVNQNAEAQAGAVVSVYDSGAYITSYTLGTAQYTIGECRAYSDGFASTGYNRGRFSVKQDIASYGSQPGKFLSVLAQYDEDNRLVTINMQNNSVKGAQTIETALDVETAEGTHMTYMLMERGNIRPVTKSVTYKPYSTTMAESVIKLYPGYTTKALTFSFDDGVAYDQQTIAILNKYNAKGTFNINGSLLMNKYSNSIYGTTTAEKLEFIKNLYSGHEFANHTYRHKPCALMDGETSKDSNGNTLTGVSLADAIEDITLNTAYIAENLGVTTKGIAWPNGYPQRRTDYAQLKQAAMEDGHVYARNKENGSYDLPSDWMEWNATAHIKTATSTIDEFIAMDNGRDMKVCFIWGHSYEFNDPAKYGCGSFEDFDANLAKFAGENVWFATCGEIYDYVTAMDKLYQTPYGVRNMSDMTLYLNINGSNLELLPGEEYFVSETMRDMPSIACWGDSLTYGQGASDLLTKSYPGVLSTLSGSPVYNMGVAGETTNTIAARQGVYDILISKDFTIPAASEEVEIKFHSSNGGVVTPRIADAGGWTPCTINGITGTMRIVVDTTVTPRVLKHAYFTRSVPGLKTEVKAGTKFIPYAQTVMADINVVFTGTNGGWTAQNTASKNDESAVRDFAQLVRTQAEYSKSGDKYVVIGLTSGDANSWKLVNEILADEFGENFLDIKGYMLTEQAAEDAGITLTDEDLSLIAQGHIPQSYLTSDKVHFNDTGYELIAKALYNKMMDLGYIN